MSLRVTQASGLEYLALATDLLQRGRLADPVAGIWEAADLQWWWRRDQHPDDADQTFWLDGDSPVGAVIFTDWGKSWGCDLISADRDLCDPVGALWPRALERMAAHTAHPLEVTLSDDAELVSALSAAGLEADPVVTVTSWMAAAERHPVPPPPEGFGLSAMSDTPDRPHHMIRRNGEHVAERLAECSLYRPDLDLVVHAPDGTVAGYGLFWADPVTHVGLVEPMRTEDRFMGMGIGKHVLAEGLERLVAAGCTRLKVSHIEGNERARRLYEWAGFRPESTALAYRRA